MVTRSPGFPTLRPGLFAALLTCLAACHAAAAPGHPALQTAAEREMAGWRIARGLDPPADHVDGRGPAVTLERHAPPPDPMDDHWRTGFGLPVPDRWISALLPHGGSLIAGGGFTRIGALEARGVAAWDGTGWSGLGDFPGSSVVELASHSGGILALEGQGGLWQWNGTLWSALPALPPWASTRHDLAVLDDRIAVCVSVYVEPEWRARVLLATPDGWTTLGGEFDATVQCVAWYGGELYAGGAFQSVAGTPARHVARWDGAAWQAVGEGLGSGPSYGAVLDLAVYSGELVAGGWFGDDADPARPENFARWNGARWAALGSGAPLNPGVRRLKVVGPELYALGTFTMDYGRRYGIARWDGTAWHTAEDSLEALVQDVATFQGELYAAGSLERDGSRPAPHLVRRRGGRWEPPLTPTVGMQGLLGWQGPVVRALAATDAGVAVVGGFEFAGNPHEWLHCPDAALWDGSRWSSLGPGLGEEAYAQDLVLHQGALHAVGSFWTPSGYSSVARLEGGQWRLVGTGLFFNAYCIASVGGELVVGSAAGDPSRGIARWDGTAWRDMGGGITVGSWVSALTAHEGRVIAAGGFDEIGGVRCRNIAAWSEATGWEPLGEFPGGTITDLLSRDGVLYASAWSGNPGQAAVARWRNGRWEPLAGPGYGWALGWFRGRLVASVYDFPGMIAILEADSTWHPLGSGLDGPALSFAERGSSLFVGGYFSRAGGKAAYGFAEWRESPGVGLLPQPVLAAPNPSTDAVYLRYELATAARARVEIYDLAGALVDRAFDGVQGAGPQEVLWRPDPGRVKAGVYFARLVVAGTSRVVRVVRIE